MLEADWKYIAGLLEGEGGFSIKRRFRKSGVSYDLSLTLSMTDSEPVRYVARVWGTSVHPVSRKSPRKGVYTIRCPAHLVDVTLSRIFPYLKSERRRLETRLLQRFRQSILSDSQKGTPLGILKYRHWLCEWMQRLKTREYTEPSHRLSCSRESSRNVQKGEARE